MTGLALAPAGWRERLVRLEAGRKRLGAGDILSGASGEGATPRLLLDGWAYELRVLDDGRRQAVDLYTALDLISDEFLLGAGEGSVVYALTAVEFCWFDRERLFAEVKRDPLLSEWIRGAWSLRSWRRQEKIVDLGVRTGLERTARLLVDLLLRLGKGTPPSSPAMLDLSLSLRMLGDFLGLSTAHMCRIFKDFETRALARYQNGTVVIEDFEGLLRIGGVGARDLKRFSYAARWSHGGEAG